MSESDRAQHIAREVLEEFGGMPGAAKDPVFYDCKLELRKRFRKNGLRKFDMELTDKLRVHLPGEPLIRV
jgi:broad specificity phosphatase PhoE